MQMFSPRAGLSALVGTAILMAALAGCGEPAPAPANVTPAEPVLPPEPPSTPASATAWTADRVAVPASMGAAMQNCVMIRAGGSCSVGISQAEIDWIKAAYGWPETAVPAPHTVTLPPFYIAETELTNGQFSAFLEANPEYRAAQKDSRLVVHWKYLMEPAGPYPPEGRVPIEFIKYNPVVYVSCADAEAYAAWLIKTEQAAGRLPADWSYRLPTEAEWELAARGVDGSNAGGGESATSTTAPRRRFPWGAEFKAENAFFGETIAGYKLDNGNFFPWARGYKAKNSQDGVMLPSVVGVKDPHYYAGRSAIGCYHMAGNVWEWTSSAEGGKVVAKGGSYWSPAPQLLISQRLLADGMKQMPDVGFRLVAAPVAASTTAPPTPPTPPAAPVAPEAPGDLVVP